MQCMYILVYYCVITAVLHKKESHKHNIILSHINISLYWCCIIDAVMGRCRSVLLACIYIYQNLRISSPIIFYTKKQIRNWICPLLQSQGLFYHFLCFYNEISFGCNNVVKMKIIQSLISGGFVAPKKETLRFWYVFSSRYTLFNCLYKKYD